MYCFAESNPFVSSKDYQPNFSSNSKCCLINPSKSEIGKISKYFLKQINSKIKDISSANQWQETSTVMKWFKNIKNKKKCVFIKELLMKATTSAKTFVKSMMKKLTP